MPVDAPRRCSPTTGSSARRRADRPRRGPGHRSPARPQPGGTAYLCAADGDGLLVSLIQSNFLHFGSGVHVPEWGINLNNRGFSFALDPARPNALAPAKRPMHTLIPAMVLRDGEPGSCSARWAATRRPQVHVQVLSHILDEGDDPADAIARAALARRHRPGRSGSRPASRTTSVAGLRALGHDVARRSAYDSGMGHAHAIWRTSGGYGVTADPRRRALRSGSEGRRDRPGNLDVCPT